MVVLVDDYCQTDCTSYKLQTPFLHCISGFDVCCRGAEKLLINIEYYLILLLSDRMVFKGLKGVQRVERCLPYVVALLLATSVHMHTHIFLSPNLIYGLLDAKTIVIVVMGYNRYMC